jgi:tetratricopeptide (TPR) repeat protein
MKKTAAAGIWLILISGFVFGDVSALLQESDALYKAENYDASMRVLEEALDETRNDRQRAEVYWRLARGHLFVGDRAEKAEEKGVAMHHYEKGEGLAQKAIDHNKRIAEAYFWKSSNIGKAGQLRGVLASLGEAGNMRDLLKEAIKIDDDFPDPYYVLGQLYAKLPGWPISFGSIENAVSLARLSIDKMEGAFAKGKREELNYDYYTQLASHLWQRNWDERKRRDEQEKRGKKYRSERDILEKSFYYEGVVDIPAMKDRREAMKLINWVIEELYSLSEPTDAQKEDLASARTLKEEW